MFNDNVIIATKKSILPVAIVWRNAAPPAAAANVITSFPG
jgi:hypothetical protein